MASVLVIDDDDDIADAIAMVLAEAGHHVVASRDSAEALVLAQQHKPALVLIDYHLPGVDTARLIADLRASAGVECVALCTGAEVDASTVGADILLAKPFSVERLIDLADHGGCERARESPLP
jgi:DNA-binding response OmpR family regulator